MLCDRPAELLQEAYERSLKLLRCLSVCVCPFVSVSVCVCARARVRVRACGIGC